MATGEAAARVLARILAEESARFSAYAARQHAGGHDAYDVLAERPEASVREVLERPLSEVDWLGLNALAQRDPEAAVGLWRQLQLVARDQLDSGHLSAEAFDIMHSAQDRARFLAVRAAFNDELQPRGAVEQALIDIAVHAYLEIMSWFRGYHVRSELRSEEIVTRSGGSRRAPTMDDSAARAETIDFVERFHRLFLRTMRAIADHRRRSPLIVQNAAQVNVGEHQINSMVKE